MKRPVRGSDGKYHMNGVAYKELFGSRQQVHNKTAYKTPGGLTRKDLMMNKWGRIVSAKKHRTAKKEKRLEKAGYFAKKGKFGYVKKGVKTRKARGSRKMKGGAIMYVCPNTRITKKAAGEDCGDGIVSVEENDDEMEDEGIEFRQRPNGLGVGKI
jgi:hypothetical protein